MLKLGSRRGDGRLCEWRSGGPRGECDLWSSGEDVGAVKVVES